MTNRAKVGGILSITSGISGVVPFLGAVIVFDLLPASALKIIDNEVLLLTLTFFHYRNYIGIFIALLGVLAIMGGVYALKKEKWGLALAGAVASIAGGSLSPFIGIIAVIFVATGKREFNVPVPSPPTSSFVPPAAS
jgi:hypothetical protein